MNSVSSGLSAPLFSISSLSDRLRADIAAFSAVTSLLSAAPNHTLDASELYFLLEAINQRFQTVLVDLERLS